MGSQFEPNPAPKSLEQEVQEIREAYEDRTPVATKFEDDNIGEHPLWNAASEVDFFIKKLTALRDNNLYFSDVPVLIQHSRHLPEESKPTMAEAYHKAISGTDPISTYTNKKNPNRLDKDYHIRLEALIELQNRLSDVLEEKPSPRQEPSTFLSFLS